MVSDEWGRSCVSCLVGSNERRVSCSGLVPKPTLQLSKWPGLSISFRLSIVFAATHHNPQANSPHHLFEPPVSNTSKIAEWLLPQATSTTCLDLGCALHYGRKTMAEETLKVAQTKALTLTRTPFSCKGSSSPTGSTRLRLSFAHLSFLKPERGDEHHSTWSLRWTPSV